MSETTLGRALEFIGQPQDVEVHRGGCWVPGSMVGWRREDGSSCRVMVRVTEGAVKKTAWADLHDVRLAEHRDSPPTESLPFLPRLPERRTGQASATADGVPPRTGRHRSSANVDDEGPAEAWMAPASWWPSAELPADKVEPTRALPVQRPRLR
jgi:hypothetical protein